MPQGLRYIVKENNFIMATKPKKPLAPASKKTKAAKATKKIRVQNKQIQHKVIDVKGKKKYVCIQAVTPTPGKSNLSWAKVTCKNCLARKNK